MTFLRFYRSPFETLVVVLCAGRAIAALVHSQPNAAARKAELLQASANQSSQKPAMGIDFFSEDADRMAEMPPYPPASFQKRRVRVGSPACEPSCTYSCGHQECDQACEPVCLPPKCETLCTKSADHCDTRCAQPKCAVVCPAGADCQGGLCPKCRTVCAPPACTTSCSDSCHSVCAQPECTWKCRLGYCPKPECKMTCKALAPCKAELSHVHKVPQMLGMDVKSTDKASLDPRILATPPVPPPVEGERVMPTSQPQSTLNVKDNAAPFRTVSPVKALKMEWEARDTMEANAFLLRR